MESRDDQEDSEHRTSSLPVPSRTFTTQELEAVIRRAVELQAGNSARAEEGVPEAEVVRIGQELGFDPTTVRRAMADVRSRPVEERGALVRIVGARTVRAARVLQRPAASTGLLLDRYLRETELMIAQRRFPDRTRYVRDSSLAAGLARLARGFTRSQALNLQQMDVAVSAIDAESCLIELSVELTGTRAGLLAGVLGTSNGLAAGWAVTVWATAIADPLMLAGIPVVAGSWYGMRAIYRTIRTSVQKSLSHSSTAWNTTNSPSQRAVFRHN